VTQTMTRAISPSLPELQTEVAHLREELQMRDHLVQQLSQELFRLEKGNVGMVPNTEMSERHVAEMRALREQLQGVEQQVKFYQEQLAARDTEIYQLRQSVQEFTDRSRMLEQVVQELPRIYREKFAARMVPIKEKVAMIQQENRRLHAELQSVSYRLAVRNRRVTNVELPTYPQAVSPSSIAAFGNA